VVIISDVATIILSLFIAWILRSRFPDMLFDMSRVLLFVPYVVGLRILSNGILEHYQLSYANLHFADIGRLYVHQLFPSAIFLILRFASPIPIIRMPLSMIAIEYALSASAMSLVRVLVVSAELKRARVEKTSRVLNGVLFGHVSRFRHSSILPADSNGDYWRIAGIISPDHLDAGLDHQGIRVFYGMTAVRELVERQPSVSFIGLADTLTRGECLEALETAADLALRPVVLSEHGLRAFSVEDLVAREENVGTERVPQDVGSWLSRATVIINSFDTSVTAAVEKLLKDYGANVLRPSGAKNPEVSQLSPDTFVLDLRVFELGARLKIDGVISGLRFGRVSDLWSVSEAERYLLPLPYPLLTSQTLPVADKADILYTPNVASRSALELGIPTYAFQPHHELAELIAKWLFYVAGKDPGTTCYGETPRPVGPAELHLLFRAGVVFESRVVGLDRPQLANAGSDTSFYHLKDISDQALHSRRKATRDTLASNSALWS